jgi:hypothetical protein
MKPVTKSIHVRPEAQRMRLRYGFNEVDAWWHIGLGEHRGRIQQHLRRMDTSVIRIFVFDKPVPDPVGQWSLFTAYVQGVLDADAVPMITFAKFHPPYDDPRNLRTFVTRCADIVWGCMEQWGAQAVREWYWCVWNEPNNVLIGGGLTFAQYRRIYEQVAAAILELIGPHLRGQKARIGGPAIDGTHQAFWMDWIARLITEVDDALVGFVSWHRYGDWRPAAPSATLGENIYGAPETPDGANFEALLMAQTPDYEARARGVGRLLVGRDILNICGEVNAIAHHDYRYTRCLNQNAFGAAYYVSALIHLVRGGADLEMRWTATDNDDAYGLLTREGEQSAACLAKELFVQHVRYGDLVFFPTCPSCAPDVVALVSCGADGRRSGVFVHTSAGPRTLVISDWDDTLSNCQVLLRVDGSTGGQVAAERFNGTVRLDGYGVAVITTG